MKRRSGTLGKPVLLAVALALIVLTLKGSPEASADPSDLAIEKTCGPEEFRPNVWVAHQCLIRLTNNGDTSLSDFETAYSTASGVIPDHYFVLYEVNGQPMPIDPRGLSFGTTGSALQPGQSADVRLVTLLKMPREGAYNGEWPTRVDGETIPTDPLHYEAHADAADPPTDLEVAQTELGHPESGRVTFQTTITNRSAMDVTQLSLTEHYGYGVSLVSAEPAGAELTGVKLLKLDLASFGKQSLAPGETITLQTTYESDIADSCPFAESGLFVEATVNGQVQLYGARAGATSVCSREEPVEPSPDSEGGEAGTTLPLARSPSAGEAVQLPLTGEGHPSGPIPAAVCATLAVTGIAFAGAAQLVRRRVRR